MPALWCSSNRVGSWLLVTLLVVLLAGPLPQAEGLQFSITAAKLRNSVARKDTKWKSVLTSLSKALDDRDLRKSVANAIASYKAVNHCDIGLTECDENRNVIAITVNGLDGKLDFSALPTTVRRVSITNSNVLQPLHVASLPHTLKELDVDDTKWLSNTLKLTIPGDGVPPSSYSLRRLRCHSCFLTKLKLAEKTVDAAGGVQDVMLGLKELDLSNNPHLNVPVDGLPSSLRVLKLSGTPLTVTDLSGLARQLPPSIEVVDFAETGVEYVLEDLEELPTSIRVLNLSTNAGEGGEAKRLAKVLQPLAGTLQALVLSGGNLTGGLPDLSSFTALQTLDVSRNALERCSFTYLPRQLVELNVSHNGLTGSLELTQLPPGLEVLDVSYNGMSGPVDVTRLPPQIAYFDVSFNAFSGPIAFSQLPESIRFFFIQSNAFTGKPDLIDIPLLLRFIYVFNNSWDSDLPAL